MINKILILIVMTSVGGGCSPQYTRFTQKLRDDVKLSGQDLKNLQYYICPRLLLERSVLSSESKITQGKLIRKSGELVDQVLIPKWTPGLVVDSKDRSVDVSFKKSTDITFGIVARENGGNYRVIYPENLQYGSAVYAEYGGNEYNVVYGESQDCEGKGEDYKGDEPQLWIDTESLEEFKKERKILEGRTLPQD